MYYLLKHSDELHIYRDFFSDSYQQHNVARLQHLASLGLPLDGKRVLEVGAGIGDHSIFYLYRNCDVLPTDGRRENVEFLKRRLNIRAEVLDPERNIEQMSSLGRFDVLHCYGFLYHISNPEVFLAHAPRCAAMMVLETCVSFGDQLEKNPVGEQAEVLCQALHGKGCRPTRPWIMHELKKGYPHVYCTRTQPKHPEFPLDWTQPPANPRALIRAVFVASHAPISNPLLTSELPLRHST